MRVWRCRICGDPYLGDEKPTQCPFCGAHSPWMVDAHEWTDENQGVELTDTGRAALEKTLELEMANASFYMCASDAAPDSLLKGMFKALSKVEAEHATVACKLLGRKRDNVTPGECDTDGLTNVNTAHDHEDLAIGFYTQFAAEVTEPRLKALYSALIEIETDHLNLTSEVSGELS